MGVFDRFRAPSDEAVKLREVLGQVANNNELLQERLAELELALDDQGWQKLSGESQLEFSREGLRKICAIATLQWLANPLVKQAVGVQTRYVFGQGVSIRSKDTDINAVLQAFLDDRKNQVELSSHQSRMQKETDLQVNANQFFNFFINRSTGKIRVRTIPFEEIEDVIFNPEDSKEPWWYKRVWSQKDVNGKITRRTAYYPDWKMDPKIADRPNDAEIIEDVPVYHVKVNCLPNMKFGVSELYAASTWAKAYGEFLKDWATITKSYARFAWKMTTKGGKQGVAAAKTRLNTTLGTANSSERNPAPTAGSMFVGTEGNSLEPIKTAGATAKAEDGRHLLLMVASATGIFEHYFGDPSTGNLATAKAMERPMELMFIDRQTLWADVHKAILEFVIYWAVKAPNGALNSLGSIVRDEDGEETISWLKDSEGKEVDASVDIIFPAILEKDPLAKIQAITAAATLDGKTPAETIPYPTAVRMLLIALGEEDVDAIMTKLFPDGEDGAEWPKKPEPQLPQPGHPSEGTPPQVQESKSERLMIGAIQELREALRRMSDEQGA